MTEVLALHWATGQSALEDANLAALLGWIDPPAGLTGAEAAAEAEDPLRWPPAGPATDPSFDNEVLGPLVRAYDAADDEAAQRRAVAALESALRTQLEPTWQLMWRAVALLRALPAGASVEQRWADGPARLHGARWSTGATAGCRRRAGTRRWRRRGGCTLERAQDAFDVQRAFDDPLVMAEFRLTGEAFAGTVVEARAATGVDSNGRRRKLRPLITVRTADPVRLEVGAAARSAAPAEAEGDGRGSGIHGAVGST